LLVELAKKRRKKEAKKEEKKVSSLKTISPKEIVFLLLREEKKRREEREECRRPILRTVLGWAAHRRPMGWKIHGVGKRRRPRRTDRDGDGWTAPKLRNPGRRPERCPLELSEAESPPARHHDPSPNPAPGDPRHVSSARGLTATQPFQL